MVSTITLALIGLVLLIPLEIILLIVVYLLTRSKVPKGPFVPKPVKKPRYAWESAISPRPQKVERSYRKVVVGVFLAVALVAILSLLYYVSGPLIDTEPNVSENTSVNGTAFNLSTVLNTTPFINHTFNIAPQLNVTQASSFYESYAPYIWAVSLIVFLGSVALLLFFLILNRRRSALLRQASQTADSLADGDAVRHWRRWLAILLIVIGVVLLIIKFKASIFG